MIDRVGLPALPLLGEVDPVLWIGFVSLVTALLIAAAIEALRQRVDLQNPARLGRALLLVYAGMTGATIAFALARSLPLALLFFWTMDLGRGLTEPMISALINRFIDSQYRATVLSMTTQTNALGQIAGGPLVGWIGNLRSVRAALILAALFLLPASPLVGWLNRHYLRGTLDQPLLAEGLADEAVAP